MQTMKAMTEMKSGNECINGESELHAPMKTMDIDEFLLHIGQFEKAQILLLLLMFLLYVPSANQTLILFFIGNSPSWRCVQGNSTGCNITGIFESGDEHYEKNCKMNRSSWEFIQPIEFSFVTEWNLICEKRTHSFLANSALFIGWAAGAILLGTLADRYGRKKILFPSWTVVVLLSFACAFVNNFWLFFVLRLFIGILQGGVYLSLFSLTTELVGPSYRSIACTTVSVAYTFAQCTLVLQAWLIPNWRTLLKVVSIPYIWLLASYIYIPESVRWLRVNKKMEEAEKILRKIAYRNKKPWPHATLTQIADSTRNKGSLKDLFFPKAKGISMLVQLFGWFVIAMVFFGSSLASADLGGNLYINFFVSSLIEFPASIITILCCNKVGRKPTVIISMLIAGLSCIGVSVIPQHSEHSWARVTLGMIGKLFITISYDGISIWSAELHPTVIRNRGIGLLSLLSRFGGAAAPWASQFLSYFSRSLPFLIMGSLSIASALFCCVLKETRGLASTEVLDDLAESKKPCAINDGYSSQLDISA